MALASATAAVVGATTVDGAHARSDERGVHVGPGPISIVLHPHGYRLGLHVTPNRASAAGTISVDLRAQRRPVQGARIKVTLTMLDMDMGNIWSVLPESAPGKYTQAVPPLGMKGHWRLHFDVKPRGASAFAVSVVDVMRA